MTPPPRGQFITLEGADGVGKSTQCEMLAARLQETGHEVVCTREPGGTPGAEQIRDLVLNADQPDWSPMTELLLFCAARRDHCERVIIPALDAGKIVLCDRFHDSTAVYQSIAGGVDADTVQWVHERTIGLTPDLTMVLLLDPQLATQRSQARGADDCRFERRALSFRTRIARGYAAICDRDPERCKKIDAAADVSAIAANIWDLVEPCLKPQPNHPISNSSLTPPSASFAPN